MGGFTINDATVTSASLYKSAGSAFMRWDVLPFGLVYISIIGYSVLVNSAANITFKAWTQVRPFTPPAIYNTT
jgi:hypothetical protein